MIGQALRRGINARRASVVPSTGVTYINSTTARGFATTNAVGSLSGAQPGDILVAFAGGNDQDASITPPAGQGWNQLGDSGLPVAGRMYMLVTTATVGNLAGGTWTWSGSHNHAVTIAAYRNAILPTVAPALIHNTNATSINTPSATSVGVNAMLVCGVYVVSNGNTPTWPGSMTQRVALAAASASVAIAEELMPSAGASGSRAFSVGATASGGLSSGSVILEAV